MHASYRPSRALDLYQATYQADPVTREPREREPGPAPADKPNKTDRHCEACGHEWIAPADAACPVCAIADAAPNEAIISPVGLGVAALALVSLLALVVALWKA